MPERPGTVPWALEHGYIRPERGHRRMYFSSDTKEDGTPKYVWIIRRNGDYYRRPFREFIPRRKRKKRAGLKRNSKAHCIHDVASRHRRRDLPGHIGGTNKDPQSPHGKVLTYNGDRLSNTVTVNCTGAPGVEQHWEECWDDIHPGPPYQCGGPMETISCLYQNGRKTNKYTFSSDGNPNLATGVRKVYVGNFHHNWWDGDTMTDLLKSSTPNWRRLSEFHTQAWDTLKPPVSKAGLAQFMYELRDLPGMVVHLAQQFHNSWKSFGGGYSSITLGPKSLADDWLQLNFGWLPFISDLQKLFDVYWNSHRYIDQTRRDNGVWLKRKRVLTSSESTVRVIREYDSGLEPNFTGGIHESLTRPMVLDGVTCRGYRDIYKTEIRSVWASGHFRYYRPEFDDSLEGFSSQWTNIQRLLTLYGANINPTLLWKITPWTWAVDWFTGVGKFIEHHDAFVNDGIVSRELFCMETKETRFTSNCVTNFYSSPLSLSFIRNQRVKHREAASSPYGFNVPWHLLSAKQLSILGAIGITRTPNGFITRG